jgi:hypothetical protein
MTYCNLLAFIFARGWHWIALNESGGIAAWGIFGGNRIFGDGMEKGKWDAGILSECKKCLPKKNRKTACLVTSLYNDIMIFDEHIFIFEYLDMFNIF